MVYMNEIENTNLNSREQVIMRISSIENGKDCLALFFFKNIQ